VQQRSPAARSFPLPPEMIPTYAGVDYPQGKGSFVTIYQQDLLSDFPASGWDDFPFVLVMR
jgi:hypothetical protein